MSLLDDAFEPYVIMDKTTVPDGYGGVATTYQDGAEIQAAIVLDLTTQARMAEQAGVTALYTVTTKRNVNLQFRDVIRRLSDGKIFRITSDGDDKKTPAAATLDMRQTSAEEWVIPNG